MGIFFDFFLEALLICDARGLEIEGRKTALDLRRKALV